MSFSLLNFHARALNKRRTYKPFPAQKWVRAFTLVELLVVIAIIGILVALLLPAIQAARGASRRSSCPKKIREVALAVTNYESAKKEFPAAVHMPDIVN